VTACFASSPPAVAQIGAARFMTVPATAVATDTAGEDTEYRPSLRHGPSERSSFVEGSWLELLLQHDAARKSACTFARSPVLMCIGDRLTCAGGSGMGLKTRCFGSRTVSAL
jgi:hypothetical protein